LLTPQSNKASLKNLTTPENPEINLTLSESSSKKEEV